MLFSTIATCNYNILLIHPPTRFKSTRRRIHPVKWYTCFSMISFTMETHNNILSSILWSLNIYVISISTIGTISGRYSTFWAKQVWILFWLTILQARSQFLFWKGQFCNHCQLCNQCTKAMKK